MTALTPTDEQVDALDLFATGDSFAIQAGAGTGKTATARLMAESTQRLGRFCAFNKSVINDAAGTFPQNVAASTVHSLAFRAVGKPFAGRLNGQRMRSDQIGRMLGVQALDVNVGGHGRKTLAAGFLGSLAMRAVAIYCQSIDPEPTARHVPYIDGIDLPDALDNRTYDNNRIVADYLAPFLRRVWADLCDPNGQLPYSHAAYQKLWSLSEPRIDTDFILFDECQDADAVQAEIVLRQKERGVQVVIIGDSAQAIYGWRGAVSAFERFNLEHTTWLSQSFRFGEAIAEQANEILAMIPDTPLRLRGLDSITSTIEPVATPDTVLCRTNAVAVRTVLAAMDRGQHPHLVGGGSQVVAFAKGARNLMSGRRADHPELACFTDWDEVRSYTVNDPSGDELRLMVRLVDEFGPDRIIDTLGTRMPSEANADLIASTAHVAKGREWSSVQLAEDFTVGSGEKAPVPEELRLLYVAVTRAKHRLDITRVPLLAEPSDDAKEPVAP